MRTSLTSRGRRRLVAALAAAALPLGIVAATGGVASAHEAPGSPIEVFTDSTPSASVLDSLSHGWWGHEGGADNGTGTGTTYPDLNGSDPDFSQFADSGNIRVAFVTTSSDGSAEHPAASAGQTVGQIFPWFMDAGLESPLNGNANPNDSVAVVSTGSEYNAWFGAGQPLQGFNNSLQMIDISSGNPSATPQGKSILNRWPAGSHISMVFYETTGSNDPVTNQPIVRVVSGHAVTAYMPFTTVAKTGDATRSSAGYVNEAFGAVAVNTTTTLTPSVASPQPAGTSINLTAHVAASSGTDTPVGNVQFFDGATSLGAPVAVNGSGDAVKTGVTLAVGTHANLHAVYTPTNTVALAFNTSTSPDVSFTINGVATNTAAAATPGADVTQAVALTATVTGTSGTPTGTVVFKDGATTIGSDDITAGDNIANLSHTFTTPGSHTVTAFFTPDSASSNYSSSQGSVTFDLAPPSGVSTDDQTVTATIPPGTITVTTPYTPANPLNLGTVNLNTALTGYLGSAPFQHINVLDTRSGGQAWTLTAIAGQMGDGAGHFIDGQNLGLTNLLPETANVSPNRNNNPGLGTITATDNPVPALPVQAGAPGSLGLGGAQHTVLHATQGPSDAWYSGTLTLFAPTTTTTGIYTGTITFTAS